MIDNTEEQELLKHEYSEVNQNFRHYSSLRFAILTVYFAFTSLLLSITFGLTSNATQELRFWAKVGGLLTTIIFFIFEHILDEYLHHFAKVARELEKSLGYRQFSTRPTFRIQARHATYFLYSLLVLFWIYALIWA